VYVRVCRGSKPLVGSDQRPPCVPTGGFYVLYDEAAEEAREREEEEEAKGGYGVGVVSWMFSW